MRAGRGVGPLVRDGARPADRLGAVDARPADPGAEIPLPHLFAAYGPLDYEILFLETEANEVARLVELLASELQAAGMEARHGVAWYPRDGRTTDALLARGNALLRAPATDSKNGPASEPARASGAGMERLRALAKKAALSNISVLILGETGVGKDVLAREIHRLSPRATSRSSRSTAPASPRPCSRASSSATSGAPSRARRGAKVGLLEAGNGGTVFLDEIGEMPLTLQAKLLRVIEEREVLPVGAVKPRPIDVRFLAATNRDLEAEVEQGTFRQDLYFRLNGSRSRSRRCASGPTRSPRWSRRSSRMRVASPGATPPAIADEAMDYILDYSWPGNIRELKNVIERALVLCDGDEITAQFLPLDKMGGGSARTQGSDESGAGQLRAVYAQHVADLAAATLPVLDDPAKAAERQRMLDALARHAGNQTRAAEELGMPRRTFITKLDAYGIARPQKSRRP